MNDQNQQISAIKQAIRAQMKFHKLTEHGDGVVEADIADAVLKIVAQSEPATFYHLDGKPAHFDIDADLGQLILACHNALDFVINGPAVIASQKVIDEQFKKRVLDLFPKLKVVIENRITVKYPYSKLAEQTFEVRCGLPPKASGYLAMDRLKYSIDYIHSPACNLSIMSNDWKLEKDVHVTGIVRELATLTAHMQQIMILFGLTRDDIELASRQQMDKMTYPL